MIVYTLVLKHLMFVHHEFKRPFELVMYEHQVFEHQSIDNHYLFRMYQDGVRRLTMRRGITEAELLRFCRLFTLDLSRPDMFEDDVVTLIWKEGPLSR